MRFASLGSGSEGNGLVVESGTTRILVDCGFGVRETAARLARLGLAPGDVSAVFVTHEHSDHVGGVAAFAARHDIPVWLTFGTFDVVGERLGDVPRVCAFDAHDVVAIGELEVRPFPVPHDARDPVQYVLSDGASRLGVLTDLGVVTAHVEASLTGCDALVLECNHDEAMLAGGRYPYPLKQRIAGRRHLAGEAAVHRVVEQQAGERRRGRRVVGGGDLDAELRPQMCNPHEGAADAAEPVDADAGAHGDAL